MELITNLMIRLKSQWQKTPRLIKYMTGLVKMQYQCSSILLISTNRQLSLKFVVVSIVYRISGH